MKKISKMKVTKSRMLYVMIDIIMHFLGFILLAIFTLSIFTMFSITGIILEYHFHNTMTHWITIGTGIVLMLWVICFATKVILKKLKTIVTYSVQYSDVTEETYDRSDFNSLTEADNKARELRKKDDVAIIMITEHCSNKYTKQNSNKLLITYEYLNPMKELKITERRGKN